MKTLFVWLNRSKNGGMLNLRVTLDSTVAHTVIGKELQQRIALQPALVWTGGKDFYTGPGAGKVNAALYGMESDVKMTYTLLLGYGAAVSAKTVLEVYRDMLAARYPFDARGLSDCMRARSLPRLRLTLPQLLEWHIGNKIRCTESTRTFGRVMALNFERFLNHTDQPALAADQFTPALLNLFVDYMRSVRAVEDSYINEHIVLVKAAVKAACARDMIAADRIAAFQFRFIRNRHTTALKPEQLHWLESTDFTRPVTALTEFDRAAVPAPYAGPWHGERMQQAVDLFVFCCYTAFHHCDRQELGNKHGMMVGDTAYIKKVRKKTRRHGATAIVKQSPAVRRILKKYGGLDGLPRIPYKVNYTYLYRLGLLMGLPYTLATGHARNTFVYMGFNVWGFDGDTIALMAGLKSPAMLAKYNHPQFARVEQFANWPAEDGAEEEAEPSV